MRLWYQTTSRHTNWGGYSRALREILNSTKDPQTEIEIYGMAGDGAADPHAETADADEVLKNLRVAAEEGFDGFLIGGMADPGLKAAREAFDIPVVGLGEASFHLASLIADKFRLITLEERATPSIVENLVEYGFRDRLAGVRRMRLERPRDLDQGFDDPAARQAVLDQFLAAARADGEAADGVGVIACSSAVMALLDHAGVDETPEGAAVIDGLTALVKLGEIAVKVTRILEGKFSCDRVGVAVELWRSYDALPRRRTERARPAAGGSARLLRRLNQQGPRFGG